MGGTVLAEPAEPAAFATPVTPAAPAPAPVAAAGAFTPAVFSRGPEEVPDAAPVFNHPAGAIGSIGSRVPAPRSLREAAGRASGNRSE